jgi:hypothetical protein
VWALSYGISDGTVMFMGVSGKGVGAVVKILDRGDQVGGEGGGSVKGNGAS